MKKPILFSLLFSFFALLMPQMVRAGEPTDDTVVLSDLKYHSTQGYYFEVSLVGSRIYTAYNMDIFLPEGISVAMNGTSYRVSMIQTGGIYPSTYDDIEEKTVYTHTISASMPQTGQLRVACYSSQSDEFTNTSGKLFRVFVTLDNEVLAASFSPKPIVKVSGIALTQKGNALQYDPADFTCRPFTTGVPTSRTVPLNINATNQVGTLILPFDAALPTGVKAYTCGALESDEETLQLDPVESLTACTPYILYAENGYSGSLTGDVDMSATYPVINVYSVGYLTGVLSSTVVNEGYILQNKGEGPLFYDAEGSSFYLPAGRCYLTPTSSGGNAKPFRFSFENTSSIATPQLGNGRASDVPYYDLSGRPVISPVKGVYINNRKKLLKQ